ncbi:MAG: ring-cleaving dioxygenase [Gemmatimonadales bacterium]
MGIHHITAIAGDPQRNLDFYTGTLGMRLVKLTVNFDDPGSYHLYFGNELGLPGSILTFFPWPDGRPGRQGTGQVGTVSLAIPSGSLGHWVERLLTHGVAYEGPTPRFDEQVLAFKDPDGMLLELVATPRVNGVEPWPEGPVPAEHAVRGLHGATIWEDGDTGSADFLTRTLGLRLAGEDGARLRFESASAGVGSVVDLRRVPGFWRGAGGVGTVHHVAFRAASASAQLAKRNEIERLGIGITPVVDRQYFQSVYFREPGGVLFEIATDAPGMTLDESPAELGSRLRLPPWYESNRERIERSLPPLRLPQVTAPEV